MAGCTIKGCGRKHHAKGLCITHYTRQSKGADLSAPIGAYKNNGGVPTARKARGHKNILTRYSVSADQRQAMYDEANGCCALCGEPTELSDMALDHDHACCPGRTTCGDCTRGLICRSCNLGLGYFKDDVAKLERAIAYLTKV